MCARPYRRSRGAGKSTTGVRLAEKLGWSFIDLDEYFVSNNGDISEYLRHHSYEEYAAQNVVSYCAALNQAITRTVFALSSGFMIYPETISPEYSAIRRSVELDSATFLLMPSYDMETCVATTVQRQLSRRYLGANAEAEEQKIRARFPRYVALQCTRMESSAPPEEVVDRILGFLQQCCGKSDSKVGAIASDP